MVMSVDRRSKVDERWHLQFSICVCRVSRVVRDPRTCPRTIATFPNTTMNHEYNTNNSPESRFA